MKKLKEHKDIIIILLIIFVVFGLFYWSEIRPVIAKRNCSWVTKIIPASVGVTKEQADKNRKAYAQCSGGQEFSPGSFYDQYLFASGKISAECWLLGQNSKERSSQPEKREKSSASKMEYDQCLKHQGI